MAFKRSGVRLPLAPPTLFFRLAMIMLACSFLERAPADAHDAPSGWTYPPECCNEIDCKQIDPGEVTVEPGVYLWRGKRIAFDSPKIRRSPDKFFHGCLAGHWGDTSGMTEVQCFFVPYGT